MLHRVFNRTGGRSVPAAGAYTGVSAVVVGGADNGGGLGLVRSLGAAGIPVIATDQDSAAPALHSRFAHKVAMSSLSGRKFIDELCELGASLRTRPVLFLTTDEVVLEVSRHRADLEQHFRFRLPLHEQLTALMQKSAFQQLAESLGFAVPRSINLRTAGDLARLHELRFPIVVKPSFKTEQYLASGFGRGYRIHSIEQARATCSRMLPILPDLIVQEWIEGPDTELYFCLQYRGASGSAVSFTGRKLSIWPREVGTTASCIGAPEEHEQLRALTDAFFEKTGFVGMGGMEFKRDVRTGQFFLIEPTVGRIDWQEEVATLGGVNIPAVAYLHELGADVEPPQAKASPVIWQDTARHWKAIAHDSRSGRRRKAKIYDAYWRLEDPWPSVVHLYGLLRRNVTRAVGRLAPMGLSSLARHLERTVELAVANEASFDFRSSEYESLYRSSHATAFQCPHWLAGIHDIVMPSIGADSVTITARLRNGRLALVVPLMRRRLFGIHKVEFAGADLCDYQNAIYDPSAVPMLLNDSTLAARISEFLSPCDLIELNKLPAHDRVLFALFPGARRAVMRTATYPSVLESDWVQWRSKNLEEHFQRHLDKKRRRLGRAGIARFLLVEDRLELVRVFEYVRRFRAGRLKGLGAYDVTAEDSTFLFYRNSAIDGAKHRFTSTYCLYLDDEPLSVAFGLRDDRRFWLVLAAFDTERHRSCSPGLLITEDVLRECIHGGLSVFDFTIGDHPYKLQFGGVKSPLFEWHIPRTVRGYLAAAVLEAIREAKRALKPLLKNRHWGRAARHTEVH